MYDMQSISQAIKSQIASAALQLGRPRDEFKLRELVTELVSVLDAAFSRGESVPNKLVRQLAALAYSPPTIEAERAVSRYAADEALVERFPRFSADQQQSIIAILKRGLKASWGRRCAALDVSASLLVRDGIELALSAGASAAIEMLSFFASNIGLPASNYQVAIRSFESRRAGFVLTSECREVLEQVALNLHELIERTPLWQFSNVYRAEPTVPRGVWTPMTAGAPLAALSQLFRSPDQVRVDIYRTAVFSGYSDRIRYMRLVSGWARNGAGIDPPNESSS